MSKLLEMFISCLASKVLKTKTKNAVQIFGNKAKRQMEVTRKQIRPNFLKRQGYEIFVFSKKLNCVVFLLLSYEICLFASLLTK